jgi:hypothetical protein
MRRSTPNRWRVVALAGLAILASCGGSDGGDSTGPGGQTGNSKFTAKIDGAAWASTSGAERTGVPITLPGLYTLTGISLGASPYTIVITLYNISGPGTYPLGVGVSVPGGNALISASTGGGWKTAQTGADGTITITTLTASRMEGTFSFTAVAFTGGATGTKTITEGTFALDVKPTGTVGPLPENAGSKLSATLNGASYNASDVSSAFNNGVLTVVGNNATRSLTISLPGVPVTGVGTYTLGAASGRVMGMSVLNGTQLAGTYSSSVTGGSGSVTITSLTTTRIKGTFTATLGAAGSGATGTVTVTNGSFDLGRP